MQISGRIALASTLADIVFLIGGLETVYIYLRGHVNGHAIDGGINIYEGPCRDFETDILDQYAHYQVTRLTPRGNVLYIGIEE